MGSEGKGKPHPHPHKGGLPAADTDEDFYDDGLPLEAKVALGNFLLSDKKKGVLRHFRWNRGHWKPNG